MDCDRCGKGEEEKGIGIKMKSSVIKLPWAIETREQDIMRLFF